MATLRERQKQQTRTLLTQSALTLFERNGYLATTIDEIAATAGATRATFYLHFSSKVEVMKALIVEVDGILTAADGMPLTEVVEIGSRELIEEYLNRKFDQWATIKPYIVAANQAAPSEPVVARIIETWFDQTAQAMHDGLDRADRFPPESRHVRCVLAFGQLEYLSRRWFRLGWIVPREICLNILAESWLGLLTGGGEGQEKQPGLGQLA